MGDYICSSTVITMHIDDNILKIKDRTYRRVLIRESYREGGKVKSRTIANISQLSDSEIEAIKTAFKYKNDLAFLEAFANQSAKYDKILGPCWLIHRVVKLLHIDKFIPTGIFQAHVLWLVMARLIGQGSRLSSVRLAVEHYGCELLGIDKINENILYEALDWMDENRGQTEKNIYSQWKKDHPEDRPQLFLYDVSSSYLEGDQNELGSYGYNRDKKKGKKQIVYGLLTDREGYPLAIEAFKGNTADTQTLDAQLGKIKDLYGCKSVTLVGDKGLLKSLQIEKLKENDYHYITSLAKPQIESLIRKGAFQLELFADELCEIEDREEGIRYILRRNPERQQQLQQNRQGKIGKIKEKLSKSNAYLKEHPRARAAIQIRDLSACIGQLKLRDILTVETEREGSRKLILKIDEGQLQEKSRLDGCYVIKTDLKKNEAAAVVVHQLYKNLAHVEWAFRTEKSCLEIRPIYLRKEERTRGHLVVCLLAYMVERHLRHIWSDLDITVQEGLNALGKITSIKATINQTSIVRVLDPDDTSKKLLDRAMVNLPKTLPESKLDVVTYKKLESERK
jgi:transposase